MKEFVPLRILSVNPSSVGASSYILLLESDNTQALRFPIVIGSQEAQSISVYLEHIQTSRPLTHDLCILDASFDIDAGLKWGAQVSGRGHTCHQQLMG